MDYLLEYIRPVVYKRDIHILLIHSLDSVIPGFVRKGRDRRVCGGT